MRANGWMLLVMTVCAIPLAVGIATAQTWPSYVTYAAWGVFALLAVVNALRRKTRGSSSGGMAGAGDVYNELYLSRPRVPVTYGDQEEVVAEEQLDIRDELAEGRITLHIPEGERASDGD